jgi:hypothetical protein
MPQLDLMTFFTQFFWFTFMFIFFYIFLSCKILPNISLNLKFRKKVLNSFAKDINSKKDSIASLLFVYDNILLKVLYFSRNFVVKMTLFGNSWSNNVIDKLNSNYFSNTNLKYFKLIGEKDFTLFILNYLLKNK